MFRHYLSLWIFQDTQVNCPDGEKIISCSCHLQSNVSECGSPKCIRKAVLCSGGDVILKKILGMTHVFTKAAKWQPKDSLPSNKLSPLSAHTNANKASPDKSVVLLAPEVQYQFLLSYRIERCFVPRMESLLPACASKLQSLDTKVKSPRTTASPALTHATRRPFSAQMGGF